MSNSVKRMDLRQAKAALAALPWMPRAFQPHPEPRAVPPAGPVSFLRAIRFALLALALGGVLFWSAPAQAQTATVLVKNTGQSDAGYSALNSSSLKRAQRFRTGLNAGGYTLSSIGIKFDQIANPSEAATQLTATVNEVSSSNPGAVVCTLAAPATYVSNALNTYDASNCPSLATDTTYFFVLERSTGSATIRIDRTTSTSEDAGKAAGWSIANVRHYLSSGSWTSSASGQAQQIEVRGVLNNNPATGAPSIIGVLEQGEVLTADTAGIADDDGLGAFSYEWLAGGTAISGATSATYTLTATEVGDAISLTVTFTDGEDNSESLTSAETHNVVASGATRKLLWLATLTPVDRGGGRIGVNPPGIGSLTPELFTYGSDTYDFGYIDFVSLPTSGLSFTIGPTPGADAQAKWIFDTGREWALADAQLYVGGILSVDWTASPGDITWSIGQETIVYLLEDLNNPATGAPSISGVLEDGEELTADTAGIADADGLGAFSYEWLAGGTAISGATSATYTLTSAEVGDAISLRVSFTDGEDNSESLTSAETHNVVASGATRKLLWLGTLTPADTGVSYIGFIDPTSGSLSPSSFIDDSNTYTFEVIEFNPTIGLAIVVQPGPGADEQATWIFDAGREWALADADNIARTENLRSEWRASSSGDVDWSIGQETVVYLLEDLNNPATGAPTITGAPRVGEALTADTSGIADDDGTDDATFTYQWVRVDGMSETDVGTDSSTYTLTDEDANKQIKVEVSFTDDLGNPEGPLFSLLTDAVVPHVLVKNTGQSATNVPLEESTEYPKDAQAFTTGPNAAGYTLGSIGFKFHTIADTSTAGSELTVTLNEESSSGAPGDALCTLTDPLSFSASGLHAFVTPKTGTGVCPTLAASTAYFVVIERANNNTHTISYNVTQAYNEDPGGAMGWSIANGPYYFESASDEWNQGSDSILIEVKGPVTNSPATGAPSIIGVLEQGEVLTADTVGIADADGVGAFSYEWLAGGTAIAGATSSTYTLTSAEVGDAISLRVSFTDGQGYSESLTSAATYAVVASGATQRLHWLATMEVGSVPDEGVYGYSSIPPDLHGSISVAKFTVAGVEYTVSSVLYNRAGTSDTLNFYLSPAFPASFTLHIGTVATVFASSNAALSTPPGYQVYSWTSTFPSWNDGQEVPIFLQGSLNHLATGAPTVSGTARVGEALTADTSAIADADGTGTFTYQWVRVDGADETDISGATNSTYTLKPDDAGKKIQVKVSFTDDESNAEGPLSSTLTDTVNSPATGAPTISGPPRVGERLTASTSAISDADGTDDATFTYQWVRVDGMSDTNVGTDSSTYTLTDADADKQIRSRWRSASPTTPAAPPVRKVH